MDQEIDDIVKRFHDMWRDNYREFWKCKYRQPMPLQPGLYFMDDENEKKRKAENQNEEDRKRFKEEKSLKEDIDMVTSSV